MKTRPPLGASSPAISRSVVLLPEPEGPSRAKNSPGLDFEVDALQRGELAVQLDDVLKTYFSAAPATGALHP